MHIERLLAMLEENSARGGELTIPTRWNPFGLKVIRQSVDECVVDAYSFFIEHIKRLFSAPKQSFSGPLCAHAAYCMLARAQSAYLSHAGEFHSGSFLRSLLILPLLKAMHIDIICLLPVTRIGIHGKKGELGSIYAARDYYALEPTLSDPLIKNPDRSHLNAEFAAFVEACHHLGMKVMADFAFRTCSRDNELMREHPDWFYWVKLGADFCPPQINGVKSTTRLTKRNAHKAYKSPGIENYLAAFTDDPRTLDATLWNKLNHETELLPAIEKHYGVTTLPAFSDCMSDPQPPWTDVTYLRFDLGQNEMAQKYAPKAPPYLLFDTIKLDVFPPRTPNLALFEYLEGVIPFYQQNYGIDGARIDMAHALPKSLLKSIVAKAKQADPNFLLWSESLSTDQAAREKRNGFHCVSGNLFSKYLRLGAEDFNETLFTSLRCALPQMGALELPDSPRIYSKLNPDAVASLMVFNALLPNTLPLINGGLELLETQPMNLGLETDEHVPNALPKTDPMHGKLAFFDRFAFHWRTKIDICAFIGECIKLRKEYYAALNAKLTPLNCANPSLSAFTLGEASGLLVILNRGRQLSVSLARLMPGLCTAKKVEARFLGGRFARTRLDVQKPLPLKHCESVVLEYEL